MHYDLPLNRIQDAALDKVQLSKKSPLAYFMHAFLAGSYIGFGVLLICMIATPLSAAQMPGLNLVMAAIFGLALSLVIFAGADIFTGNVMIMFVGLYKGRVSLSDFCIILLGSYIGNFAGSLFIAGLATQAELFLLDPHLVMRLAERKMHAPFKVLFLKGFLCNWLVVLALWCSYKLESEAGKLIMVWWCILGFVGSGFEHSVANMTFLSLANFLPHGPNISWSLLWANLVPVTLGNFCSAIGLVALPYLKIADVKKRLQAR